ncbi:MAG TPA: NAD(P)-dependent oxidoreductase [Polyangiaceae bacterium]|nr:NAD(P)-dependent oxidoreductase [Polyangiaceae bacterium]
MAPDSVEGVNLRGKTLFITGASRGIGKAIALRAARDGANIAVVGKTAEPHPKLPGTVSDSVREIEAAGGKAIACIADVRVEPQMVAAVADTVAAFGGIDILVNNASAISLTGTEATELKRFDLMFGVNTRGTFLCSKLCIPHLRRAENPHILMMSPPLSHDPRWFAPHLAYSIAKYGMSLCVLGLAAELERDGIAVNALWPRTVIRTAAVQNLLGGDSSMSRARNPEIVADAAHVILTSKSRELSGKFLIDEEVLRGAGVTDFSQYADVPDAELLPDFFL